MSELSTVRDYQPGQRYVEQWNRGPSGPAFAQHDGTSPASRVGDALTISPSLYSDRASPSRLAWAMGSSRGALLRDGEQLAERFSYLPSFTPFEVPPDAATYRYEQEETRGPGLFPGPDLFDLSTFVTAAWTFRSQHVAGATPAILPLPTRASSPSSMTTTRATGQMIVLPVAIERPAGADTPPIARVTVDISFDDGATWSSGPGLLLGERWFGVAVHPSGAAYASLRGAVRDVEGNTGEATIIHAYRLAAKP